MLQFVDKYRNAITLAFLIVPTFVASTYFFFRLEYVAQAVNPETITDYRVEEAILSTKRKMRWCLGKLVVSNDITKERILACAD